MAANRSNLQCFLDNVTPSLESQFYYKPPIIRNSSCCWWGKQDIVEYYTLNDLWNTLNEWSVYGTTTEVMLPDGQSIVQYFVPHLSAIQLYTDINVSSLIATSNFVLQNGVCWCADEFYSPQMSESWNPLWMDYNKMDLGGAKNNLGFKYFEYFETSSPYTRMPLVDKVQELAQSFPGLNWLKSMQLSPLSWMAISWYPLYTIPAQLERENLDSCFLTYHSLSPSEEDNPEEINIPEISSRKGKEVLLDQNKGKKKKKFMTISLPPFGLVSHKVNATLWNNPETGDSDLASSLLYAAGSWLRMVQAQHHDFNFFIAH